MNILIASGAYPPMVGGSAHYAKNLEKVLQEAGNNVRVVYFRKEHSLPSGIRHILFFFRTLRALKGIDLVLILDTFSSGLPATYAARLCNKKTILRIGGDFLWEQYIERTGNEVPLPEFYKIKPKLSLREKIIYALTKNIFQKNTILAFNTEWQKNICIRAYGLENKDTVVLTNVLEKQDIQEVPTQKIFFGAARNIKLKNRVRLERAFAKAQKRYPEIDLISGQMPYETMLISIKKCYAVVLPSISDISPDLIAKAVQFGKPFIVTKYTGLSKEVVDRGLTIDPLDEEDIQKKIEILCQEELYSAVAKKTQAKYQEKTWQALAEEIISLAKKQTR